MAQVTFAIHTRPPMERMLQIHERLQAERFPNCNRLSKEFEVSSRTIKRDIDFMRCRLNLPIEYDDHRYGYYYTEPVERFPTLPLSEAEVFSLLVAQKAIQQYRGTPFHGPLEIAYRRLTGQLDPNTACSLHDLEQALSFRPFAPDDGDLETFQTLYRGLTEHRRLRFRYRNLGAGRALTRVVEPRHLACVESHWYLFAHDLRRDAIRTFVLARMTEVELTDQRFRAHKSFDLNAYLKGSFSVFRGTADFEVVLVFDRWATDLIRGRTWHASQELIPLPHGRLRMRLRLNSLEEIERFVLSWGIHATVVRPKSLVKRIRHIATQLHRRYTRAAPVSGQAKEADRLI